jgi:hypothetical protein
VWTLNNHHLKESLRRFDEVSFWWRVELIWDGLR